MKKQSIDDELKKKMPEWYLILKKEVLEMKKGKKQ